MEKYITCMICILTLLYSCNTDKQGVESHDQIEKTHNEDEIIFTQNQAKEANLEFVKVSPTNFHQIVKTSGQILSAQGDEITISATASGIVSFNKTSMNEGESVSIGESLLSISSKNIVDGDPTMKAKSTYKIAENEFERAGSLIKDKLISQKEYNTAKLNYEQAKISYESIGQKITSRGISVSTPMSGFIKTKLVGEGQYVEIGQPLLTITQNKRLKLKADVSERYYNDLGYITSANFKTPYNNTVYQLSELNGRLASFGKSASDQDYYLPINFEFDNVGQIVPGSYVEVFLIGQTRSDVIAIPISSLIEEQGLYFVYLQVKEDGYIKQEVKLGTNDGDKVEILSGIKKEDVIVSKGAYYIKLASATSSLPHGHEH